MKKTFLIFELTTYWSSVSSHYCWIKLQMNVYDELPILVCQSRSCKKAHGLYVLETSLPYSRPLWSNSGVQKCVASYLCDYMTNYDCETKKILTGSSSIQLIDLLKQIQYKLENMSNIIHLLNILNELQQIWIISRRSESSDLPFTLVIYGKFYFHLK